MLFSDKLGREWSLRIDVAAMRRAKAVGVNLSMPVEQLREFMFDDLFLAEAIWAILSPKARNIDLDQTQFETAFDGLVYAKAREALWEAMEQYFDPGKSQMLRAAIDSTKAEMASVITSFGSTEHRENSASTLETSKSPTSSSSSTADGNPVGAIPPHSY